MENYNKWRAFRSGHRGFTLLELLVVIGIIALLVSILLPVLARVREQGRGVVCQSHQRQLWQGVMAFALDNDNRLVGNCFDVANAIPSHRDFLMGANNPYGAPANAYLTAPQAGTLFKYVNHDASTYLCPARLDGGAALGSGNSADLTSNGHFDYGFSLDFTGCKLEHLPGMATVTHLDGTTDVIPCPYVVEEGPSQINHTNMEAGHSGGDTLAHNHFGGSYYVATDGSCQFYNEPAGINNTYYSARTPTGKMATMGNGAPTVQWGYWDGQ